MNEREIDVTTESPEPKRSEPEREPGSYYYDDGTNYELYEPGEEAPDDESDAREGP